MLSVRYIQVSRVLLHVCVAELWFGYAKSILGERGMGNKFIWTHSIVEGLRSRIVQDIH
jgi:hypothetical protein